jgi:hypothetical protein
MPRFRKIRFHLGNTGCHSIELKGTHVVVCVERLVWLRLVNWRLFVFDSEWTSWSWWTKCSVWCRLIFLDRQINSSTAWFQLEVIIIVEESRRILLDGTANRLMPLDVCGSVVGYSQKISKDQKIWEPVKRSF